MFLSAIVEDGVAGSRSEMAITLFMSMSFIPELLSICTSAVLERLGNAPNIAKDLFCRIQCQRSSLIAWYSRWKRFLQPILVCTGFGKFQLSETVQENYDLCDVAGSFLSCLILSNRMVTALGWDKNNALERDSFAFAKQILHLNKGVQSNKSLSLACSLKIAEATLLTTEAWTSKGCSSEALQLVSKDAFLHWNSVLGRKI